MTFSQYAGIAIVPTLSRIVLAAVFITAGWLKFQDAPFTAEQAAKLDALGIKASPATTPVVLSYGQVRLASYQTQPETPATTDEPAAQASEPSTSEASTPEAPLQSDTPATQPDVQVPATSGATQPSGPGMYTSRQLHYVTLMLHEKNWPAPVAFAWLAALTELIGGALLAVGLFSRVWGLGLAIAMGVALYLVSLPELQAIGFRLFGMDAMKFATFGLQSALFVLAFGIFLTGAGPLSLDRFLFGGRPEVVEVEVERKG